LETKSINGKKGKKSRKGKRGRKYRKPIRVIARKEYQYSTRTKSNRRKSGNGPYLEDTCSGIFIRSNGPRTATTISSSVQNSYSYSTATSTIQVSSDNIKSKNSYSVIKLTSTTYRNNSDSRNILI
jgi:hypothetical protein